jgi:hypothetical protein
VARPGTSIERGLDLLERDVELNEIGACLDDAREGGGRLVLLEGVAGIGKTRLLRRARALARERGMQVLSARATELEREFAFGVVRQLLEPVLFAAADEERTRMLQGAAAGAAPVFERAPVGAEFPERTVESGFTKLAGLYWLLIDLASASCGSCCRGWTASPSR